MAGLKLDIRGLDKTIKDIDRKIKEYPKDIQDELDNWALETASEAKRLAPKDEGHLAGSIAPEFGKMYAAVTVAVNYAAYVEFGTRKFAAAYVSSLPADWESFAAKYKGPSGGSFADFLKSIIGWCKRKGIDEKAAYPIVLKILRDGSPAKPFLFPAVMHNNEKLKNRLKALFN